MSRSPLDLLRMLHKAAVEQRQAVKEGRIDDALNIFEERQTITAEIDKIVGTEEQRNKFHAEEKNSAEARQIINNIIEIDTELRTILETDKENIGSKLQSIRAIKQQVMNKQAYHDTDSKINFSI
ncbi:MAG: flagellar protein FliT [Dissulfurispiraceae bacterium]|nr:flagellar protein FliT [Dissulfurispiraceae bacterium]